MGLPSLHHDNVPSWVIFRGRNTTTGKMNMRVVIKGQGLGLDGGMGKEGINIWEDLTHKPSLPLFI